MVRLTGLLLYANESCGVRFIFGDDWNDEPCASRIFVYLYTRTACNCKRISDRTKSIQKQIVEYNIKSKYPEEYSTVDKVVNTVNTVSCRISRLLISYLISKQARLNTAFKSVLVIPVTQQALSSISVTSWL